MLAGIADQKDYLAAANTETVTLAMVETRTAPANLGAMLPRLASMVVPRAFRPVDRGSDVVVVLHSRLRDRAESPASAAASLPSRRRKAGKIAGALLRQRRARAWPEQSTA